MPPEPGDQPEVNRTEGSVESYMTNSIPDNELPHTGGSPNERCGRIGVNSAALCYAVDARVSSGRSPS
jgi:hypothetical protein